ncbi:MAG TPA: mechanosensitive ion channel family protein [Chthoniobacterales bacterium]
MDPNFVPEDLPSVPYVPAHFDWLADLAERFSFYIDGLSLELSTLLGAWSRQPIVFALTPAKILLLSFILATGCGLAWLTRNFILRLPGTSAPAPGDARYWRTGILFALRRAVTGFFIFTGAFFAWVPLLPHLGVALGGFPTFALAAQVAGLGYLATVLGFCLRVVRLVQNWFKGLAARPSPAWYFAALPVVGEALFYNVALCAFSTAVFLLQLPDPFREYGYQLASLAGIAVNTVLAVRTVLAVESMVVLRSSSLPYDAYKRRQVETRVKVLRRLLVFVFVVLGLGTLLMAYPPVRQFGAGLLTSAGVAGVIAGLAAQKSLSTLIAGFQLAITEPLRLNDEVIVEGEWGIIEEITLTYVVIRVWDQRRLVVPLTYFLEKPFQNWTRSSSDLLGVVFLYVDFLVPLDELRAETQRIVQGADLWDGRVFAFQVTEFKPDGIEIRILASAASAPQTFDLRCEVRRQILSFLQARYPQAFPRLRASLGPERAPLGREGAVPRLSPWQAPPPPARPRSSHSGHA